MKFTPLRFQSALAAGGLALMPFVLMQFTFPRQGDLISIDDLSGSYDVARVFLLMVMLVGTLLHFYLIAKLSLEFIVALGMTVNVALGPVAFFFPGYSFVFMKFVGIIKPAHT